MSAPSPRAAWLRYMTAAIYLCVAAAVVLDLTHYGGQVIDDTFISFRYARNWIEGRGLVFNAGERVEGYTNFSFVAAAAAALRLGIDPVIATKVLSVLSSLAALFAAARMQRFGPRPELAWRSAPVVLLLSLEAYVYWSVASFETMPFTGLLALAFWRMLAEHESGRGHASAILFALLALTRPEGAYLFALSTGASLLADLVARNRTGIRRHAVNGLVFAVVFGSYFAWRYTYYGRLLPNTFYAKVTGGWSQLGNGMRYLGDLARAFPAFALALALALPLLLVGRGRAGNRAFAVMYLVTVGYIAYVVGVGGDFMPFFRFFLPILPMCALLLAWSLAALDRGGRALRVGLPVAIAVNLVASHATEQPYRAFVAHRTAEVGEQVGNWLSRNLAPEDWVAVNTAGAVPYFSGLPSIDTLGLTDAAIASRPIYIVSPGWAGHRKGWGDYVLSRRPRVILWYNSAGAREPFYLGDHELAESASFRFFYRAKAATLEWPHADAIKGRPLARFLGDPFEVVHPGKAMSPDLGLEAELHDAPMRYTVLRDSPVTMTYFELDERDRALWPLAEHGNVDALLGAAVERWRSADPRPVADRDRQVQVESLCEQARQSVETGDYGKARRLLSVAARQNAEVHSPLVYQYIANLAVMTGDLLVAVGAEKEALRLAPENELYRRNLRSLLTVPFKEGSKGHGAPPNEAFRGAPK
jgi:hypothetical protein